MQGLNLQCGQGVIAECKGATVPMTDAGFELFVSQAVDASSMAIGVAQRTMASSMTFNQIRALNAAGCAVTNLGNNFWHFIAAAWYAAKQFGQEQKIRDYADQYYPYICTCNKEMDKVAELTAAVSAAASVAFSSCSEQSQALSASQRNSTNSTNTTKKA